MDQFQTADGEHFFWESWIPSHSLRAVMLAVHGMGSAASEFSPLGGALSQQGIAVYAPNLRGQGLDPVPQRRGYVLDIAPMLSDLRDAVLEMERRHPHMPLLLFGESMGALLVIRGLCTRWLTVPPLGVVLCAPVVNLAHPPSFLVHMGLSLGAYFMPHFMMPVNWFVPQKNKATRLTHDPKQQEFFENAPYQIRAFSPSFFHNMGLLIDSCNALAESLTYSHLLVLGAGQDDYILPDQLRQWFERVASCHKELEIFEDSCHRLLWDQEKDAVLKKISLWVEAQIPS